MSGRGKPYNLTATEIARLVDAYESGVTTKDLGSRFGISASTVSVILRKAGVLGGGGAKTNGLQERFADSRDANIVNENRKPEFAGPRKR